MITTFRSLHPHEPPQNIIYRNYKNFNAQHFLNDLEFNSCLEEQPSTCVSYDKFKKILKKNTDKHAPEQAEVSEQPNCINDQETYTYI